jgi:rhodanese-related sulfurtransferase
MIKAYVFFIIIGLSTKENNIFHAIPEQILHTQIPNKEIVMKQQSGTKIKPGLFSFVMLLFLAGLPAAVFADTEFRIVTTDQLKEMIDQKQALVLIDSRTPQEYQEAHIKGAISIPEKKLNENKALLPEDKSSLLVIYCNGVKCGKSKRLAVQLEPLGYTNIMIYSEGIPVWEERAFPIVAGPEYSKKIETRKVKPADLKKMIDENKQDFVLVDVRDPKEYGEGHIPTAINIPAETFASQSGILPKEKKIIVYCNTGSRSYLAYRKLNQLAYPDIYQTLLADWKDAGLEVVK